MQFTNESLDAILDQANGVTPSNFISFLRSALSARDKFRKGLQLSGVTLTAAADLRVKTFYAVGFHRKGGGWKEVGAWELEGVQSVARAMADAIDTAMPGESFVDLAPQLPAAYVGLSRKGHGHFQQARSESEWVDVYVFKSESEADAFRADFMKTKRPQSQPITNLVRKT